MPLAEGLYLRDLTPCVRENRAGETVVVGVHYSRLGPHGTRKRRVPSFHWDLAGAPGARGSGCCLHAENEVSHAILSIDLRGPFRGSARCS